ncbi:MAG: glycosyltransferase family 2 protein [Eubacteriales bacterium]|nr:glycosyltransferase family 2 protein [Eubacteriales bacterium]
MSNPLISIVLPVYNIQEYLERCFQSVTEQDYESLEILFVDDGSTDRSGEMLDDFSKRDSRISVFHKENGGLSDARNFGTEHASGEFITYVDPDDSIDPDYVSYLYNLIVRFDADLSVCQHRTCYQNGKVKENAVQRAPEAETPEQWLNSFLYNDVNDTSAYCKLIARSLLSDIRFPKGKIFEDLATMYRLIMKADRIAVGFDSKYNYMFHDNSISNSKFNEKYFDYSPITDQVTEKIVEKYPSLLQPALAKRYRARFSVLNLMINSDADRKYTDRRDEMISYLRKHKRTVLSDPRVSKVERAAASLISISYPLYRMGWKWHRKNIMG